MRKCIKPIVIGLCLISILLASDFLNVKAWTYPNYARCDEIILSGLWFDGAVHIQPSHPDVDGHYAMGWFEFNNGPAGFVRETTGLGQSKYDDTYYRAYRRYRDVWSFNPNVPKVTWVYGAVKVPLDSDHWPW